MSVHYVIYDQVTGKYYSHYGHWVTAADTNNRLYTTTSFDRIKSTYKNLCARLESNFPDSWSIGAPYILHNNATNSTTYNSRYHSYARLEPCDSFFRASNAKVMAMRLKIVEVTTAEDGTVTRLIVNSRLRHKKFSFTQPGKEFKTKQSEPTYFMTDCCNNRQTYNRWKQNQPKEMEFYARLNSTEHILLMGSGTLTQYASFSQATQKKVAYFGRADFKSDMPVLNLEELIMYDLETYQTPPVF